MKHRNTEPLFSCEMGSAIGLTNAQCSMGSEGVSFHSGAIHNISLQSGFFDI